MKMQTAAARCIVLHYDIGNEVFSEKVIIVPTRTVAMLGTRVFEVVAKLLLGKLAG